MELHHLTATRAKALFTARELSPVELLDAVVARAEQVEPLLNAFTEQLLDDAYAAAKESERRYLGDGPAPRALEGIPLAVKEEQAIAGRTLESGSLLDRGHIAEVTHPVVERVVAAGAVLHARTTMPEFGSVAVTHSKLWGVTRNPWNPQLTPGGSSGGAAAALAAGETVLATGSDFGGSLRIPASFCGIVGFKPPLGRVPALPPLNADPYYSDGPLARSVADAALLQNVLSGPHPHDPVTLRPAYVIPPPEPAGGLRVALCLHLGDYPLDQEVVANTRAAADALRAAGVDVQEVTLPWRRADVVAMTWAHFGAILAPLVRYVLEREPEGLTSAYIVPLARKMLHAGSFTDGLLAEAAFYRPLGELFERFDALLCPTMSVTGLPADAEVIGELMDVGGEQLPWDETPLTVPFNIVGRVPVLAVPSGVAGNGVPTGVQIVGRSYDDATVFTLGAALERELGLWTGGDWWPRI